ncbi:MAG: hypothetical protein H7A37_05885 [Chlamydiales bacterium]|nr:hypothetical protein [Chlamydiales bacterium]
MTDRRVTPPQSPLFYFHIAEATYREDPQKYLDKALGKEKVEKLDSGARFGVQDQWLVRFFKDLQTGELIVGFRGTDNIYNKISFVPHTIADPGKIFKKMNKQMDKWSRNYGSISTFVGHSAGGYFATHIKKDWKVKRITMNGHKCEREGGGGARLTINLRIYTDVISKWFGSARGRYIDIELPKDCNLRREILKKAHRLQSFARAFARNGNQVTDEWLKHPHPIEGRTWHEIAPKYLAAPLTIVKPPAPKPRNTQQQENVPSQEAASSDEDDQTQLPSDGQENAPPSYEENQTSQPQEEQNAEAPEEEAESSSSASNPQTEAPSDTNSAPQEVSGLFAGKEWQELGERTKERLIQSLALESLRFLRKICRNFREKKLYSDLYMREFSYVVQEMEISNVFAQTKKGLALQVLRISKEAVKQGSCILLSRMCQKKIHPLAIRCFMEFSISFFYSGDLSRREQLQESVAGMCRNMIYPAIDACTSRLEIPLIYERAGRIALDTVLETTPEEIIGSAVEISSRYAAKKITDVIPKNRFLDNQVDKQPISDSSSNTSSDEAARDEHVPDETGVLMATGSFMKEAAKFIYRNNSGVRDFVDRVVGTPCAIVWLTTHLVSIPVYLSGRKRAAHEIVQHPNNLMQEYLLRPYFGRHGNLINFYPDPNRDMEDNLSCRLNGNQKWTLMDSYR